MQKFMLTDISKDLDRRITVVQYLVNINGRSSFGGDNTRQRPTLHSVDVNLLRQMRKMAVTNLLQ